MKALGYCRVSTDKQKDEGTIQIQVIEIEKYCMDNKIQLVQVFTDDGISGANEIENRIGLPLLFQFLETNNDIDAVIIYKLDRLARDLYIQEHIIRQMEKLQIKLISTKEKDLESNDPMRKAFRQFLGIMAEAEKGFITMRLSAGRKMKASKGGYAGGRVPLGYKVEDNLLKECSESSKTIKLIYTFKKKRKSFGHISRYLNENNYPTSKGGQWHPSTVKYILENKIYKGKYIYKGIETNNESLAIVDIGNVSK